MDLVWPDPGSWTADHLHELMDGGHSHGTLVASHWRCNLARRYKNPPARYSRAW
jgi:hypothetical protein